MTRRNWKRIQPTSLRNALELCKDHAKERHNLSVERIAEQMGLADLASDPVHPGPVVSLASARRSYLRISHA